MVGTRSATCALLASGLAIALSGCGSATTTTQPEVVTNVMVNADKSLTRNLDEPVMVTDRSDDNTVYLFGIEMLSGACRFYTSHDRGYSWTLGASPAAQGYPSCNPEGGNSVNFRADLKQASDGTLLLAFAARNPSTGVGRSVMFARSSDKGHNWTTVVVDAGAPESTSPYAELNFEPHFAIDPGNSQHIFIDWRRSNVRAKAGATAPPTRAYEAASTNGGVTFSTPTMMFDKTTGFDPPYPVIVNNTLFISWHQTFSAASSSAPTPPDKLYLSSSRDGGKTWTDNVIDQGHSSNVDTPVLLYDTTRSKFDVVWDDDRDSGSYDVFFSTSSDGKSWSNATRLNNDGTGTHRDHEIPAAAIAPNGRIDVAWYDYRNDPYPPATGGNLGNRNDLYTSSSSDGGSTWTSNVRVNTLLIDRLKGTWNNQYFLQLPPAIASNNTWAVASWSDTRNGDQQTEAQDLFAAPLALTSSVIPAGYAGATVPGYGALDLVLVGLIAALAAAGLTLFLTVWALRRRRPELGQG